MKKFLRNCTILSLCCWIYLGIPLVTPADELGLYIKNISADSVPFVLLVDKSQQHLFVLNSNAPSQIQIVDTFRITTGKVDGNKEKEGDQKTPEGIYRIVSSIPGEQLPEKYGPVAFVLDYPNLVDQIRNHNGSNIWIHGRDEAIVDRQTEGCISLENGKLLQLADYITLQQTLVIIVDSLYHKSPANDEYLKFNLTDSLINHWAYFWEKGDLDKFASLISEHFKTRSWKNKSAYLNNKKNLETLYAWKAVSIDKLWLLQSDYEARASFLQEYLCPTFYSRGLKTLQLIWADSVWQIISEDFIPLTPQLYVSDAVAKFLDRWLSDWQSGSVDRYLAHYDSTFSSREYPSFDTWSAYKRRVLWQSNDIKVHISGVKISSRIPKQWTVSFRQDYYSDHYSDRGLKTLRIKGHPRDYREFKILSEEWEPLK
ncbi:MAG TPA: hypothetical protein ENN20_03625 [Candidatus Marinimicrobia bacterium]|nr:hypothetical protein [Candidatus Neomarinimicrobiota bacterium]